MTLENYILEKKEEETGISFLVLMTDVSALADKNEFLKKLQAEDLLLLGFLKVERESKLLS